MAEFVNCFIVEVCVVSTFFGLISDSVIIVLVLSEPSFDLELDDEDIAI